MNLQLLKHLLKKTDLNYMFLIIAALLIYDSCFTSPLRQKIGALEVCIKSISETTARIDERTLLTLEFFQNAGSPAKQENK